MALPPTMIKAKAGKLPCSFSFYAPSSTSAMLRHLLPIALQMLCFNHNGAQYRAGYGVATKIAYATKLN